MLKWTNIFILSGNILKTKWVRIEKHLYSPSYNLGQDNIAEQVTGIINSKRCGDIAVADFSSSKVFPDAKKTKGCGMSLLSTIGQSHLGVLFFNEECHYVKKFK